METKHTNHTKMYSRFAIMLGVSFIAMYFLMYAMVDGIDNVLHNINQVYMAGLMTMAMLVIELVLMWSMYPRTKVKISILVVGIGVGAFFFFGIRNQTMVNDTQFLKSMIPHHAAAVLMVEKADIEDPEIKNLAQSIIEAQEKEILWMKSKLQALENENSQK